MLENKIKYKILGDIASEYYRTHVSTSPFAITDKIPRERVETIARTYGGSGAFGGVWWMDTKPEHIKIFICPVTGSEFTEQQLRQYKDGIADNAKQHALDKLEVVHINRDVNTMDILVGTNIGNFKYNESTEELVKI